ncbi:PCDGB protein, partial [Oreocharis arfaki]|nr:PCDGB protein [Oreocharis arfaki]
MFSRGKRCGQRQRALFWGVLLLAWEAAWGQLRYSVPEEMPKGSFVGDVAKDLGLQLPEIRDRGVRVVSEGRTQYFALHGKTGHLVTAERIDREQLCESVQQCVLRCELIVEGEMKFYEIEVEIMDINDNAPSFRQTESELRTIETTPVGSRFPLPDAHDPDSGRNSLQSYELSGDEHLSLAAEYTVHVPEDVPVGSVLVTVTAPDADEGLNGYVKYSFKKITEKATQIFHLDSETGEIALVRSLDFEEGDSYEFELWVRAEDGGAPALSSNVSVRLLIVDENDNAPQVLYPPAAPSAAGSGGGGWSGVELAPRSSEAGALVAKVVAVDADAGQNAWLSYELAKATEPGLFRVGLHSGEVRTARSPLARDAARQSLVVVVKDHGRPALSATATLSVVLAESVAELLAELGSAAEAAAPGEPAGSLTRWLVLAVAAVCCLFVGFLLLLLALRLRRWRRERLPAAESGGLRGVPVSHFVGIDGVRAFLQSYSHEVSLTADSRKSQLRLSGGSCCDTLPARPPPDEPAPLLGEEDPA